ncbi:MAG: hypothetical protein DI530_17335 [Sphingomonas sp.]|nr:MAG: hypothetical protein DI530_17335 [Sphingomonas sp.]
MQLAGEPRSAGSTTSDGDAVLVPSPGNSVVAKAGGESPGGSLRPLAQSPFPREHTYQFFSANGTKQVLRLDFQSRRFELLGASASVSGTFAEDASEPGTFMFASDRNTLGYNTARFRMAGGAVIGAFPVAPAYAKGPPFQILPFIAVNGFVTDAASLDGSYAPLETNRTSTGLAGGGVISTEITEAGTRMTTCIASTPYAIAYCPSGLARTYAVRQNGDLWHATNSSDTRDQFDFAIGLVGGERVFLSVGAFRDLMSMGAVERTGLRVGVPAGADAWPLSFGTGAAVGGAWGRYALDGTTLRVDAVDTTGQTKSIGARVGESMAPYFLSAVRAVTFGSGAYGGYAVQNKTLFVAWGAPAGLPAGLSIATVSGAGTDSRTGDYTAFGLDGQRYAMRLDFDARNYSVANSAGALAGSGTVQALAGWGYELRDAASATRSSVALSAFNSAVIGSLPLVDPASGAVRQVPFVAARDFVTAQPELGTLPMVYAYWFSAGQGTSNPPPVTQTLGADGTSMSVCAWLPPDGLSSVPCPVQGQQNLIVTRGERPGAWRANAPGAAPGSGEEFYLARIGGDLVYLSAQDGTFKIGLDISPSARAWGATSTSGVQVTASLTMNPIAQQFACLGYNFGTLDCMRIVASPPDDFGFFEAIPSTRPVRRATFPAKAGVYTFHQGRTLMVMQGRTPALHNPGLPGVTPCLPPTPPKPAAAAPSPSSPTPNALSASGHVRSGQLSRRSRPFHWEMLSGVAPSQVTRRQGVTLKTCT